MLSSEEIVLLPNVFLASLLENVVGSKCLCFWTLFCCIDLLSQYHAVLIYIRLQYIFNSCAVISAALFMYAQDYLTRWGQRRVFLLVIYSESINIHTAVKSHAVST